MFSRHLRVRGKNFTSQGSFAKNICLSIIGKLWTGSYYKTSLGHYPHFYSRDFGMMVPSLLSLGKKDEVRKTLDYALSIYQRFGEIRTFINVSNKPVNFPSVYSPDSVAYMFRSVALLNDYSLTNKYKFFLQQQLDVFFNMVVDKKTGLPKRNTHFGGMRDHSIRDASCYDASMIAMLSMMADKLKLNNPLKRYDYKKLLIDAYWTGNYFKDDLSSNKISADANIFPFWLNIISDKKLLKKVILSIQETNLDKPFPVKYVKSKSEDGKLIIASLFSSGWQADSIWPMVGLPFIEVVMSVDKKLGRKYLLQYKRLMEKYGTFLEVYDSSTKPYKSLFYSCDEGMIWCSLWLDLFLKINN